jgi:hypothetical protein
MPELTTTWTWVLGGILCFGVMLVSFLVKYYFTSFDRRLADLHKEVQTITLAFRLVEKDIGFIQVERKALEEYHYIVKKAALDLNLAFDEIRALKRKLDEGIEPLIRDRTHYINNKLMVLASKIQQIDPAHANIDLGVMPTSRTGSK